MPRFLRVLFLIPFLFLPAIAHADPVPLTIVGGTITGGTGLLPGGLIVPAGLSFSLIGLDPTTGNTFNLGAAARDIALYLGRSWRSAVRTKNRNSHCSSSA